MFNFPASCVILMPNFLTARKHSKSRAATQFPDLRGMTYISAKNDTRAEIDSAPTPAIPELLQSVKRHTTIEYIKKVKWNLVPPFEKQIWQRNDYEHIIRNEK